MGVSVARVPLPAYFRASSRCRGRERRNSWLGEKWNRWERWTSGRVAKTSWRENKSGGDVELGRIRGLVSAFLDKGLPFYGRNGLQQSSKPTGYLVWTTRSLTMVSPWGLGGVSAVSEEDDRVASRRCTVVTLKGWGPTI
jgi:hypothetical protein